MTADSIKEALKQVKYPGFTRDIVSFGLIRSAAFIDGTAKVSVADYHHMYYCYKPAEQHEVGRELRVSSINGDLANTLNSLSKHEPESQWSGHGGWITIFPI